MKNDWIIDTVLRFREKNPMSLSKIFPNILKHNYKYSRTTFLKTHHSGNIAYRIYSCYLCGNKISFHKDSGEQKFYIMGGNEKSCEELMMRKVLG